MLDLSIDDVQVCFLNITLLPGYLNGFVSRRDSIPIGTVVRMFGFRRPLHNSICYSYKWNAEKPINGSGDEIHMGIEKAKNPSFMVRSI